MSCKYSSFLPRGVCSCGCIFKLKILTFTCSKVPDIFYGSISLNRYCNLLKQNNSTYTLQSAINKLTTIYKPCTYFKYTKLIVCCIHFKTKSILCTHNNSFAKRFFVLSMHRILCVPFWLQKRSHICDVHRQNSGYKQEGTRASGCEPFDLLSWVSIYNLLLTPKK